MTTRPVEMVWRDEEHQVVSLVRNVSTRYVAIAVNTIIGLLVLPFNVRHLGSDAYGLWMLTASLTTYFTALDLGYGGAVVKFVAEYRARRDAAALNEILSTMFFLYTGIGVVCYLAAMAVAFNMAHIFNVSPEQAETGKWLMLLIAVNVALFFPFSVYGGIINGFQRYYLNNVVGTLSSIAVAVVNVVVLLLGYGVVHLVLAQTLMRVIPFFIYRRNAHKVFPALALQPSLFRRARLRELTGFSVYIAIIDWSARLNFSLDALVIGVFLNTTSVAVWTVASRIGDAAMRLTNQLNSMLFPVVVDSDTRANTERLRALLLKGTRLSLATVIPVAGGIALIADPLIHAWVGPRFAGSVVILQLLSAVVVLRVGTAIPTTLLKGARRHQLLARWNSACGVANLLLSMALVKWLGLVGVAIGTLIPVGAVSLLVIFPEACRRVGITPLRGYREAVWPTLWPAVAVGVIVMLTRPYVPPRLTGLALQLAVAGLVYLAIFFTIALERGEQQWYAGKAREMWKRRRQVLAAA